MGGLRPNPAEHNNPKFVAIGLDPIIDLVAVPKINTKRTNERTDEPTWGKIVSRVWRKIAKIARLVFVCLCVVCVNRLAQVRKGVGDCLCVIQLRIVCTQGRVGPEEHLRESVIGNLMKIKEDL